jgi:hypothetical protein
MIADDGSYAKRFGENNNGKVRKKRLNAAIELQLVEI